MFNTRFAWCWKKLFLSVLVIFTCKYVNAGFVCFASNRQFKGNAEGRPSGNGTP